MLTMEDDAEARRKVEKYMRLLSRDEKVNLPVVPYLFFFCSEVISPLKP